MKSKTEAVKKESVAVALAVEEEKKVGIFDTASGSM